MRNPRVVSLLVVLIAAVISCYVGLLNKYPLVYPDTGMYLASGFRDFLPTDRPIIYGLFARHVSLAASPWLIIFAQALITCWVIYLTFGMFLSGARKNLFFLFTIVGLTLATGYSFNISILIPDIFTGIVLLALVNLLLNNGLSKIQTVALYVIFIFSAATHFSNIPILFGTLIAIFLGSKIFKNSFSFVNIKRTLYAGLATISSILLVYGSTYVYAGHFKAASASHVFIMHHLIETGILKPFLDEKCTTESYSLCDYKDNLPWDFIWDKESPVYKTGGWEANKEEYNKIIREVVITPSNWPLLGQKTIEYGFKQIFSFRTSLAGPQLGGSPAYGAVKFAFRDSVREYVASLQNQKRLNIEPYIKREEIVVLLSLVLLLALILQPSLRRVLPPPLQGAIIVVVLFSVISAFICGNLSTIEPRYMNRIVWILPVLSVISLSELISKKSQIKSVI